MDYLKRTRDAYRRHGIELVFGMNPQSLGGYGAAPCTHFIRMADGESLTYHLGIALGDILALERYCTEARPSSILVIGNGLGFSSIALALMNPRARVVTIEPDVGLGLTNQIAQDERLRCIVVQGSSPHDTARIVGGHCDTVPDLVLIDGMHTDADIAADFAAIFEICGEAATYFVHDVVGFGLWDGWAAIADRAGERMTTRIQHATPGGMGVVMSAAISSAIRDAVEVFTVDPAQLEAMCRVARVPMPERWRTSAGR